MEKQMEVVGHLSHKEYGAGWDPLDTKSFGTRGSPSSESLIQENTNCTVSCGTRPGLEGYFGRSVMFS